MSPPIREEIDRLSLVDALLEGTIDCVSTAHNPFQEHEKNVEYDLSPAGVISFETNLSSCYQTLKEHKEFCWTKLIKAMSSNPSRILEIDSGNLSIDMPADIAIFDPNIEWEYGSREGVSQATNSPFEKHLFKGKIMQTFVNGKIAFELK
jgi:dihydroorotase